VAGAQRDIAAGVNRVLREDPLCEELVVIEGAPFARIERSVGLFYRQGHELSGGAHKFLEICRAQWPERAA
jgi:hypothetical protein